MGTRANYLWVKNKAECENGQWLKVGNEFLESEFENIIYKKCNVEMIGNTTTHWDGHPETKIPVLAELIENSESAENADWQDQLVQCFGYDYESGCDYAYIYNVTTKDFAILHLNFPLFNDGQRRFGYTCIWSGKFDEISALYEQNEEETNNMLGEVITRYRKYKNGKVYRYDQTNLMFVEEDVEQ